MDFARQPPPHFRGMDPHRRVDVYRRHLPHWRQAGATYFITFRLNDSLPQSKLDSLRELRWVWEQNHPEPRSELDWTSYAKQYTRLAERWLDEGHGECWLRQTELAHEVRFCFISSCTFTRFAKTKASLDGVKFAVVGHNRH